MSTSNTAVWLLEAGGQFVIQEAPMYTPGPDEILVKNKAVAVNPSLFLSTFELIWIFRLLIGYVAVDWKIQLYGAHLPFPSKYPFVSFPVQYSNSGCTYKYCQSDPGCRSRR
jgi:hypothetical protein